ncbi:hypothetical protein SNE40_013470 [Patella caerulea]|uniref:Wnt inhibitory factor 1 n=1 Tax=Patella caerulea TaxID=87958 RepID=A0AAN8JDJ0_PATCE
MIESKGRNTRKLALWIDKNQVGIIAGYHIELRIIENGRVEALLMEPGLSDELPPIPSQVDTVNLTWQGGDQRFRYWFENLTSLDQHLLYNPLLSIPAHGWIPHQATVFQMSIPCTGKDEGVASIVLGLHIYTTSGHAVHNTPIIFKLKKRCTAFVTTSVCEARCENGGSCVNSICLCRQGFSGKACEIALCNPRCENNGTCVSPRMCACPAGYSGHHCEKVVCGRPCQNGGQCLPEGFCFCPEGFYGDACELSRCNPECIKKGTCNQPCKRLVKPDTDVRPRRRIPPEVNGEGGTTRKQRRKNRKDRRAINEKKILKTEKRILKIINRKSKTWNLTRDERRQIRKIQREVKTRALQITERNYLVKILTGERDKLNKKEKQKLKRYKKLLKLNRKRRGKAKTKTKRRKKDV